MDVFEMAKLEMHSQEWFDAAFENCNAPVKYQTVARRICRSYGIKGQSDPAYIANILASTL